MNNAVKKMQSEVSPAKFKTPSLLPAMLSHRKRESILHCLYPGQEGTETVVIKAADHHKLHLQ